ncbi:MAG: hypothetical protein MUC99_00120 [Anaerolineae bacterium]|nr:hypothetical protein [Anaerolineae bacterium]
MMKNGKPKLLGAGQGLVVHGGGQVAPQHEALGVALGEAGRERPAITRGTTRQRV